MSWHVALEHGLWTAVTPVRQRPQKCKKKSKKTNSDHISMAYFWQDKNFFFVLRFQVEIFVQAPTDGFMIEVRVIECSDGEGCDLVRQLLDGAQTPARWARPKRKRKKDQVQNQRTEIHVGQKKKYSLGDTKWHHLNLNNILKKWRSTNFFLRSAMFNVYLWWIRIGLDHSRPGCDAPDQLDRLNRLDQLGPYISVFNIF